MRQSCEERDFCACATTTRHTPLHSWVPALHGSFWGGGRGGAQPAAGKSPIPQAQLRQPRGGVLSSGWGQCPAPQAWGGIMGCGTACCGKKGPPDPVSRTNCRTRSYPPRGPGGTNRRSGGSQQALQGTSSFLVRVFCVLICDDSKMGKPLSTLTDTGSAQSGP